MDQIFTAENLIALATLTGLEIALGIDNLIFLSIVTGRLPEHQRPKARFTGLAAAMVMRILLLLCLGWLMGLTTPLFEVMGRGISGQKLILLLGGLFLIGKSTIEIHHNVEHPIHGPAKGKAAASFGAAIVQIMLIDMVFSLDSVITAIGMARAIWVMIVAVILSMVVMMIFANRIADFVERHPSIKILALAFLILIGVLLVVEGWTPHAPPPITGEGADALAAGDGAEPASDAGHGHHGGVNKGYVYFAMAFALAVELLNIRRRVKAERAAAAAA